MKKKILYFETNEILRNTLLEQLSLNRDFDVLEAGNFKDIEYHLNKSSFDLIIMGTDREAYGLTSIVEFIKKSRIKDIILFLIGVETNASTFFRDNREKYYFIEKPFRIKHLNKKISTILAKISNSNAVTHKIGPFTFFPVKKVMMLGNKTKVELTGKEVDILKCLISSGEEAVDRDQLLKQVWNYSSDVTTHTLETHIYRLRQKLEFDSTVPRLIISKGGGFSIGSL